MDVHNVEDEVTGRLCVRQSLTEPCISLHRDPGSLVAYHVLQRVAGFLGV